MLSNFDKFNHIVENLNIMGNIDESPNILIIATDKN